MTRDDSVWQESKVAETFLEGVRGGLPLAAFQIELIVRLARQALPVIGSVLDLGCGDGVLGRAVLASYPQATGVFLDFSEPMLAAARAKGADLGPRASFVRDDFGQKSWAESVRPFGPFDLIVSGFAIHHQPDERKREVYREIYDLL